MPGFGAFSAHKKNPHHIECMQEESTSSSSKRVGFDATAPKIAYFEKQAEDVRNQRAAAPERGAGAEEKRIALAEKKRREMYGDIEEEMAEILGQPEQPRSSSSAVQQRRFSPPR